MSKRYTTESSDRFCVHWIYEDGFGIARAETAETAERIAAALNRLTPDRERVAIAICEAFTTPKGVLWWATDEETREKFRREADAAIDAMGETP